MVVLLAGGAVDGVTLWHVASRYPRRPPLGRGRHRSLSPCGVGTKPTASSMRPTRDPTENSPSMRSTRRRPPAPRTASTSGQSVPATPVIPVVAARNYRYGLTGGDNPPWKPVSVYDDGRRVYVEFPRGIVQGEMPPIFVIGPEGEAQIANTRIYRNVLIVDRLFGAAELRLGSGKEQQTVRIVRTDGRPS